MVLRIAVLIKQVPVFEQMSLDQQGRLRRDGEGEMNPYCRRAVSKGVELARASGGSVTAITLGPATAQDVLREAIAWGADDGVLVSDPAFAGSDTLASARALAAVIQREGPFDLILLGRNSVDADTGQVGPQLAELLGLPFAAAARTLDVTAATARVRSERDDGWREVTVPLPAVLSCAERLCEPCKVPVLAALEPLRVALGAEFGATRKITDEGWLPHARQIGLTGHAIAPDLYVVVGASGKFNHMVGVRGARTIVAINYDPSAPVFKHCDVGIVGDWHEVVPLLAEALSQRLTGRQLAASARKGR